MAEDQQVSQAVVIERAVVAQAYSHWQERLPHAIHALEWSQELPEAAMACAERLLSPWTTVLGQALTIGPDGVVPGHVPAIARVATALGLPAIHVTRAIVGDHGWSGAVAIALAGTALELRPQRLALPATTIAGCTPAQTVLGTPVRICVLQYQGDAHGR
jgi:hypothetical protein